MCGDSDGDSSDISCSKSSDNCRAAALRKSDVEVARKTDDMAVRISETHAYALS